VAFISGASDLTANDTNGNMQDVFVRDLRMGTTALLKHQPVGNGVWQWRFEQSSGDQRGREVRGIPEPCERLVTTTDINGSEVDIFVRPVAPDDQRLAFTGLLTLWS
jgi:hypothetical protein